jgi:hypothetical protein
MGGVPWVRSSFDRINRIYRITTDVLRPLFSFVSFCLISGSLFFSSVPFPGPPDRLPERHRREPHE